MLSKRLLRFFLHMNIEESNQSPWKDLVACKIRKAYIMHHHDTTTSNITHHRSIGFIPFIHWFSILYKVLQILDVTVLQKPDNPVVSILTLTHHHRSLSSRAQNTTRIPQRKRHDRTGSFLTDVSILFFTIPNKIQRIYSIQNAAVDFPIFHVCMYPCTPLVNVSLYLPNCSKVF